MNNYWVIKGALETLGLTPNAVTLYLQSYLFGRCTVGRLAHLAKMDRSSAHLAVAQLRSRELLIDQLERGRTYVWVKPPREILARLQLKTRELETVYSSITNALPQLEAGYFEQKSLPMIRRFSGAEELRHMTGWMLEKAGTEILLITNQAAGSLASPQDRWDFTRERIERNIALRVLAVDCPKSRELKRHDPFELSHTRIMYDERPALLASETYLLDDALVTISLKDTVTGFLVRSEEFVHAQRWAFEQLWKTYE